MKIPTMQKRFIPEYVSQTAGSEMALAGQLMDTASSIAKTIQDKRDESSATVESSNFKLEALKKRDELSVKYGDDPSRFETEYNNYLSNSKKTILDNTKVSGFNKRNFADLINKNLYSMQEDGIRETRKLSVVKAESDFKRTAQNLGELSYEYGKIGDFENFLTVNGAELGKLAVVGKDVLPPSQLNDVLKATSRDGALNYLNARLTADLGGTMEELRSGKYNDIIPREERDKLIELGGQQIVALERWNKTKEAIAGDKVYRDALNRVYEGKTAMAEVYNFIEANPQLSQHEKEFFVRVANNTQEELSRTKSEKITTELKALAQNDLNELYNMVASSDSSTIEENLKTYGKFLNEYLTNNLITKEEYRDYSQKITPFENDVLQNNYADQYDRKRALSFDYGGAKKVNQLANDLFYNAPNPADGIMQGMGKNGRIAYSIMDYLTPNYNPKLDSGKKIDEFIKNRTNKVNNIAEDDKKDDLYYKTNKFAIDFTNYVYRHMTVGMDELIKKEAEEKRVDPEQYKQSLNSYDLERRQDLVLEALGKRFILENTNLTEKHIDEAGYKNILKQQDQRQKQKAKRDTLMSKANKKIFSTNNLTE
jgi:hypothetical protein